MPGRAVTGVFFVLSSVWLEQACAGSRGESSVPGRAVTGTFSVLSLVFVGAGGRRFARRIFRALEGGDWAFSVFSLFFVGASVRRDAAPRIFYEILNRNLFRKMRKQDFIFLPKCYLMKLVKIFFSASG